MQTEFTEDQERFREVVAKFFQAKSQPPVVRALMVSEKGYDPAVWEQLCGEIGLTGIHLPEVYGGSGFGPVELGIVAEEMGRYLYCGPFLASSVMAGYALLAAGFESTKSSLLPDIAAGRTKAALVLDNLDSPARVGRSIVATDDVLTGEAQLVVDAQNADLLIVIAREDLNLMLYAVAVDKPGVTISAIEALDPTRKLAKVKFSNAETIKVGEVSPAALESLWDHICVALAHEMIGGAERLLDSTIDYTKMRYQFGRPIGSFQGLKHRCADLMMALEFAKAATHHAAFCLAAGEGEPYAASMAKAMAADTYIESAKEAIQMRGGIGFTWEEDTHLWYKRAKSSEVFMGTSAMHRERMMQKMESQ